MQQNIDQILSHAVESGALHGAAMIICNSDEVCYRGAAGNCDSGGGRMQTDSVAAIMSMTKAITGTAAMQLVEQGSLHLDRPAGEVCPYLSEVTVLTGYSDAGEPILRPPSQPVTLRHLLTHTSGFAYGIRICWNTCSAPTPLPLAAD